MYRDEIIAEEKMSIGGLLARAALPKEQKKKPCMRCGSLYDPKKEDKCPYCGDLDERGLTRLLDRRESEHQANRQLGVWFILAVVVILFITILVGVS